MSEFPVNYRSGKAFWVRRENNPKRRTNSHRFRVCDLYKYLGVYVKLFFGGRSTSAGHDRNGPLPCYPVGSSGNVPTRSMSIQTFIRNSDGRLREALDWRK